MSEEKYKIEKHIETWNKMEERIGELDLMIKSGQITRINHNERLKFIEAWALESYKQRRVLPFKTEDKPTDEKYKRKYIVDCIKFESDVRLFSCKYKQGHCHGFELCNQKRKARIEKPERSPTHCPDEECSDKKEKPKDSELPSFDSDHYKCRCSCGLVATCKIKKKIENLKLENKSHQITVNAQDKEIELLEKTHVHIQIERMKQLEEIERLKTRVDNKCQRIEERDKTIKQALEHMDKQSETIILIDGGATPHDRVLCVRCSDMKEILEGKP